MYPLQVIHHDCPQPQVLEEYTLRRRHHAAVPPIASAALATWYLVVHQVRALHHSPSESAPSGLPRPACIRCCQERMAEAA